MTTKVVALPNLKKDEKETLIEEIQRIKIKEFERISHKYKESNLMDHKTHYELLQTLMALFGVEQTLVYLKTICSKLEYSKFQATIFQSTGQAQNEANTSFNKYEVMMSPRKVIRNIISAHN